MKKQKLLNIGCGNTYDKRWINVDIYPHDKLILNYDIRKGLPFENNYFDVVYSSHLLEHLSSSDADRLVSEIYRVLIPGGIVRLVVPDLEQITKLYINKLNALIKDENIREDYNWMYLEMYDQIARSSSGGEMIKYLSQKRIPNRKFVISRIGQEGEDIIKSVNNHNSKGYKNIFSRITLHWFIKNVKYYVAVIFLYVIGGKQLSEAFKEGMFRNSGEIHRKMYDKFSLGEIMRKHNFINLVNTGANISKIHNFRKYNLDLVNGKVRKPDSLFMEGFKNAEA